MGVFKRERERDYGNGKITKKIEWVCKVNGNAWQWNEGNHGKYAKILAEESFKAKKKINNYIVHDDKNNCSILKIYSKTYGYYDVLIDDDDVDKVIEHHWMVSVDKTSGRTYIRNNKLGRLQRYIMNAENETVDHINRNTLDNRKCNLRDTSFKENGKNLSIATNNNSGITGVSEGQGKWYARITINSETKTKSFSINKYGYENAKERAIRWRFEQEKKNGFIGEISEEYQYLLDDLDNE